MPLKRLRALAYFKAYTSKDFGDGFHKVSQTNWPGQELKKMHEKVGLRQNKYNGLTNDSKTCTTTSKASESRCTVHQDNSE